LLDGIGRGSGASAPGKAGTWDLPVSGRIAVAADALAWDRHVLQQVNGSIDLAPGRIAVEAAEVRYCGATGPFSVVLTPGRMEAKAKIQARGQDLSQSLICLAQGDTKVTGTYDLDAELTASGPVRALVDAVRGTFRFAARDGRIVSVAALDHALAVDEVAAQLQAEAPSATAGGFEYREISLAGSVEAGRAHVDPGLVDSPRVSLTFRGDLAFADGGLDVVALIAPLNFPERAGQAAPLARAGRGGSVVVVPVSIRGTARDPKVSVLPAAAVGATLGRLLGATILLPIRILDIPERTMGRKP